MDVQTLELSIGFLGRPKTQITPVTAARGQRGDPDGAHTRAIADRRPWLIAYTAVSIIAGLTALVWTTLRVPVWPTIDPNLDGSALAGPAGGMLLWIAFGIIGSLRVLPIAGGLSVWTFHFPFIAAAMVLGGPTAGAWVAFLSTLELRELETQPWYGILANHSVMAFAAVAGGLTYQVVDGALAASLSDPRLAPLIATVTATLVLAIVSTAVAAGTIILREGLSATSLLEILIRSFGRMTVAEVALAWVLTVAYVTVGWWAPAAIAGIVLATWPSPNDDGVDPLTKLMRNLRFRRSLEGKLTRARHGLAPGGLLLMVDLSGFGQINKDIGFTAGNLVLAEIGRRLRGQVRLTDIAGRLGGDEFALFFDGAIDLATARRIARRVEQAILAPIATPSGTSLRVGASIGAIVVRPSAELASANDLLHRADQLMQAQKALQKSGRARSGIRFEPAGRSE